MTPSALAIIGFLILGFGLISGKLQKSYITPPMVFTTVGLLVGSPQLKPISLELESEFVRILAELTLVLILFTDASRINLQVLRREYHLPARLLGIAFPLSIVIGTFLALSFFPNLDLWQGAILAAVLSPTDAALGQAVVINPQVPVRIRQALNIESGLNDGIALPFLLIFLALAETATETVPIQFWLVFTAKQIFFGLLVGIAVGYFGGKLVHIGGLTHWMNHDFQQLSALALSLLAFALAELVGGNGLISTFCAGLAIGTTSCPICQPLYEFAEVEGQLLVLLIFLVFGAIMVWPYFEYLSWAAFFYGILSLTVVRMVAVAISLIGARFKPATVIFLGWFGPRGIASILFGLLIIERTGLKNNETLFATVTIAVLLSIFAHGFTALPGSKLYGKWIKSLKHKPHNPEHISVTELPVRLRYK